jgi:hypothetical protein
MSQNRTAVYPVLRFGLPHRLATVAGNPSPGPAFTARVLGLRVRPPSRRPAPFPQGSGWPSLPEGRPGPPWTAFSVSKLPHARDDPSQKWVTIVWYRPNSAGVAMSVRIRWFVQLMIFLGAGTYLFLHMEWLEDRPAPFATPRDVGRHHHYISELSFRADGEAGDD